MKKTLSFILTFLFIMQIMTSAVYVSAAGNTPGHSPIESDTKRHPLTLLDPTPDDEERNETNKEDNTDVIPENDSKASEESSADKIIDTLIAIAENEVGYVETGVNKTKYGKFTNSDGNSWCAPFISWCATKAELTGAGKLFTGWGTYAKPYSILKDNTFDVWYFYTDNGDLRYAQTEIKKDLSWVTKSEMVHNATGKNDNGIQSEGSRYTCTPQKGDLIFFRPKSSTDRWGHVGLVYDYKDGYVYYIDGNGRNQGNSTGYAYLIAGKDGNAAVSKWKIAYSNDSICAIARPDYVSYAVSLGYANDQENDLSASSSNEATDNGKKSFTDVHIVNHPAEEAVDFVYERGYMKGVSETEFAPDITMTRAMFVTVMYRMENEPSVSYSRKFKDVERGSYYEAAVEWGSKNGIIKGISDKEFAPHSEVTREQTAVLLYRWLKAKGDKTRTDKVYDVTEYIESGYISDYAEDAVEWMLERDIISEKDIRHMKQASTRSQAAQMLAGTVSALEEADRFPF